MFKLFLLASIYIFALGKSDKVQIATIQFKVIQNGDSDLFVVWCTYSTCMVTAMAKVGWGSPRTPTGAMNWGSYQTNAAIWYSRRHQTHQKQVNKVPCSAKGKFHEGNCTLEYLEVTQMFLREGIEIKFYQHVITQSHLECKRMQLKIENKLQCPPRPCPPCPCHIWSPWTPCSSKI